MTDEHEPVEHELIRTGTLVDFEVVDAKVEPTAARDDRYVRLTLQMPKVTWSASPSRSSTCSACLFSKFIRDLCRLDRRAAGR
jgi:hypothetical protein